MAASKLRKPLLIWDGDCRFCRAWVGYAQRLTNDQVEYVTSEEIDPDQFGIEREALSKSVHLVLQDGKVLKGAEAVFTALSLGKGGKGDHGLLWCYRSIPLFRPVSEAGYEFIAENRYSFSMVSRFLWGSTIAPLQYQMTRWLFLRGLALVFMFAFCSLQVQWRPLIGGQGLTPVAGTMGALSDSSASFFVKAWHFPTVFLINHSDATLQLFILIGIASSLLLLLNVAPFVCLMTLTLSYLSFVCAGGAFFGFQWDALLIETGLLACFIAPWKLRPKLIADDPVSKFGVYAFRFLLFKLMFLSGFVKLASHSQPWQDLTALQYHFQTQPLPNAIAWYFHHAPEFILKSGALATLLIELCVPFLMLGTRWMRSFAALATVGLQLLIMMTGNYTYFNLLTLLLCLWLLDDGIFIQSPGWNLIPVNKGLNPSLLKQILRISFPVFATFISGCIIISYLGGPGFLRAVTNPFQANRTINSYGLFAAMTTVRNEIIIEGSADGIEWKEYEFKWKPGKLDRAPGLVAPHQPRVDWQMWFAALGDIKSNPWLVNIAARLLSNDPPTTQLFETNPFPDKPPQYVRMQMYKYEFTTVEERKKTGQWWTRTSIGLYLPPVSIKK